jgi:hypothetical protein
LIGLSETAGTKAILVKVASLTLNQDILSSLLGWGQAPGLEARGEEPP